MIAAVIVAAGQGLRMGSDKPKQFLLLDGKPIILHTLEKFLSFSSIDAIVLVVEQTEITTAESLLASQNIHSKNIIFAAGGESRQASVFNGLQAIDAHEGIVLIHDGVRPLVSERLIATCIQGARDWGACIPTIRVNDTLKRVNNSGMVESTVIRQRLHLAQTPQAFQLSLIRKAHQRAIIEHWQVTDDASLVEHLGRKVRVVPGMAENIKITTPQDLQFAEVLLKMGAGQSD